MDNLVTSDSNKIIYCVECNDQEASVFCEQCDEDFCEVCYDMLHRTGNRRLHTFKKLNLQANSKEETLKNGIKIDAANNEKNEREKDNVAMKQALLEMDGTIINSNGPTFGDYITKRSKTIPLRLDSEERQYLKLLEAALNVSEYTDKIDIITYSNKARRIVGQIKDLCAIISGLLVAGDYKKGSQLFSKNNLRDNATIFQQIFEVGRRHKIMNPEKMRSTYGKLMYMLMDSCIPEVEEYLGFSCIIPIKTVYDFLKSQESIEVLHDENIVLATREIVPDFKTRGQIDAEVQRKQLAIRTICEKYANERISKEDIERCLLSISDNNAFLRANRDPCDKMIKYLSKYFNPVKHEHNYSLAIQAGRNGHRLTHSHSAQYTYVYQSLTLWREIMNEMFLLWNMADEDLISPNVYRLTNTGQGLQRIQPCPNVSRAIHKVLNRVHKKCGSWVGSSVVHLGDKNVPNSFMFIDKYNQVARILTPIVSTLDKLDLLAKDVHAAEYIQNEYGSIEQCRKDILYDLFRHGFDGSGGDNYFDAGSCIDGRLTSAWNWCSTIEKKKFFPIFLMTGFIGFDGTEW
ncbi:uncharacterized protein BX663DRAFT_471771 [Cokeromyces recurvatus]|uniref:uncharacterized protein n=1 Tax=Cokeromyces recurvatus TaxID=90255 RepID=UPI00221F5C83|nr:uncharacterized protein BX663DRAFT_471771 [Cokeromyces recurvatus]KAI7903738.1 hypothetical protein BX663DRAFT_471771 [Cokeromyces recurvatus]